MRNPILFSTQSSAYLADQVANELGIERGKITINQFADGEDEHIIDEKSLEGIHRRDAIMLGAVDNSYSYLELTDLITVLKEEHARSVFAVVPYLGWSSQERRNHPGQATKGLNRVRGIYRHFPSHTSFFDLHHEGIKNVHDGRHSSDEISSEPLVASFIGENHDLSKVVLVAPDEGRGKWVSRLAKKLGTPHVVLTKTRFGVDQVRIDEIQGAIQSTLQGKIAILFDDMIRTGGTIIEGAKQCRKGNAAEVKVIATHAILPKNADPMKDAEQKLTDSVVDQVVVTDSHPRSQTIQSPKFRVLSTAKLFAEHIKMFLAR
jgi:ribose-phosphate pyrophosphokinase